MRRNALVPGNADEQDFIRMVNAYSHLLTGLCTITVSYTHLRAHET